jgi:hypothetical protein
MHTKHLQSLGAPALDLLDQFRAGELARGLCAKVSALDYRHDSLQVHVEAQFEHRLGPIDQCCGQRLARR